MSRWLSQASQDDLYDFTHPILGDLFLQALEAKEEGIKTEIEAKLFAWCAAWQEHKSHYALQYYPAHLLDAEHYDDLFALARNDAFRQAQQQVFHHAPDLPLRTLQLALETAIEQNDVPKMAEFLLAHAQQIMTTIAQEIPLAPIFAEPVHVERAWELADMWQQYDQDRWLQWYLLIALALHTHKHLPEKAVETLARLRAKLADVDMTSQEAGEHNVNLNIYLLGHIHRLQKEQFFALAEALAIQPDTLVNQGLPDAAFDLAAYFLRKNDAIDEDIFSTFFRILDFKMFIESPTVLAAYSDLLKEELQRLSYENTSPILQLVLSLMTLSLRIYLSSTVDTKRLWCRSIEKYSSSSLMDKERTLNRFFNGGIEEGVFPEFSPPGLNADEIKEVNQTLENIGAVIPKISNRALQKEAVIFYASFGSIFNLPECVNHAHRLALQLVEGDTPEHQVEQIEIFYKIACAFLKIGEQPEAVLSLIHAYIPINQLQLNELVFKTYYYEGTLHKLRMIGRTLHEIHAHEKAREVVNVAYRFTARFVKNEREKGWSLWGLSEILRLLHEINEQEHAKRLTERLYKLIWQAIEQHKLSDIFKDDRLADKLPEIIGSFEGIGGRQKIQNLLDLIKAQIQDKRLSSSEARLIILCLITPYIRDYNTAIQVCRSFIWHGNQGNVLYDIVKLIVEYDIDEAIRTVQLIEDGGSKGKVLYCIVSTLVHRDDDDVEDAMMKAFLSTSRLDDDPEKAKVRLKARQALTEKLPMIMNFIQQNEFYDYKTAALSEVVETQAILGDISGAIRTVQFVGSNQDENLVDIMRIQLLRNDVSGLFTTAQYIEDQNNRGQCLYELATKIGVVWPAKTVDIALQGAQLLTDPAKQAEALFTIAAIQAGLGNWQAAQPLFFSPALNQNLLSEVYLEDELEDLRQNTCQAITEFLHSSSKEKQESKTQERILLDTYAGIKLMTGVREIVAGHTQIDMAGDELILLIEPVTPNTAHIDVNNILNQMSSFTSDVENETDHIEPNLVTLIRFDHAITDIVTGGLFLSGDSIEEKIHMGTELERHLIVKRENKDVHEQAQENQNTPQLTVIHLCVTALMQASDAKNWIAAYQTLEQAVEIADPIELCIIALLYNRSGNVNRAKAIFRQALEKFHGVKCTGEMPFLTRAPRRFDVLDIAYFLWLAGEIEWAGEIVNDTFSTEDWHCEGRFDTWEGIRSGDFEAQWYELSNNNDKVFGLLRRVLVIQRLWGRTGDSIFEMLDRLFVMYDQLSQEGYYLDEKDILVLEFQRILLLLHAGFPEQALQKMQPIFNVLLDYMEEIIGRKGSLFSFATSSNQSWLPFSIIDALLRQKGTRYVKELLLACAYYHRAAYNMCERLAKAYPEQAAAIADVLLKHEPLDKKSEV